MLRTERQDGCLIVTIARPETKNALDWGTLDQLRRAFEGAKGDPSLRSIILTGEGKVFVSGGDLRELRGVVTPEETGRFVEAGRAITELVAEVPVPVIAALPGPAVGGGAEIALACDLRIAEMRARICFKQAAMGVTTAWGTVPRLLSICGPSLASRLLFTGHEIGAAEAYAFGLVDAVCENGAGVATALTWAMDIAQGSPTAIAEIKSLLRTRDADRELLRRERERFVSTWLGSDHREAMDAYFERRAPNFATRRD
ncbi:MAG: enoyl-CoA hydratase/isomerase family protein [Polyangiaceae bacterium]